MKNNVLKLFLWVALLLFPLNWLRGTSYIVDKAISPIIDFEWVHIVMHLIIYSILTLLIIKQFGFPKTLSAWSIFICGILLIAILQEELQLITKDRSFGIPEWFDLGVDGIGVGFGILFYRYKSRGRIKKV
jgi:hypothetical protein